VKKLPFMFKSDLRDNYPDRIFNVSQDELVRYHVSSGTTGKPTTDPAVSPGDCTLIKSKSNVIVCVTTGAPWK
jgi:phenylacetate-coenzyme A ligase PaaK-like adenylate-forming protein